MADLRHFEGLPESGMWSSFKLDCRYCWSSLKLVAVEHDWRGAMKALLTVDRGLKELIGGGLVFLVCNVAYFYFVFPLAGIGWTVALYLGFLCAFLWVCVHAVRVRHDIETQEHTGELNNLRAELGSLRVGLTNAETQTQEAQSSCRELETERASLRASLKASEEQHAETTKHKLVYEVRQKGCRVFVKDQGENPPMLIIKVELRFDNRDTSPWTVRGLDVALYRQGGKNIFGYIENLYSAAGRQVPNEVFERMFIERGEVTKLYLLDAVMSIMDDRVKTPSDLSAIDFLKVTLRCNATQSPVEGWFHVDWEKASTDRGAMPRLIRGVSVIDRFTGLTGL